MKIINLIKKSLREQIRSYWVLLLTLSMGPFFIFVYFLIIESSKPQYKLLLVNNDKGIVIDGQKFNYGKTLASYFMSSADSVEAPFKTSELSDKATAIDKLKNRKADALIVISASFSQSLNARKNSDSLAIAHIEFLGDLTSSNYLITAVWANEMVTRFSREVTNTRNIVEVNETALGSSSSINMFDMIVPGILIVSLIMLMFPASIAFVSEVENKTIMRLKLSKLSAFEFLAGISFVQLLVGIVSVLLTLLTAILLGFHFEGSLIIMLIVAILTSISIISASLIIAAATKTTNEVLVVGNFPMFLFMFFTGAAFPLKSDPMFSIAGYDISVQGLMSPTHAISALNKAFILQMDFKSIIPEIIAILLLSLLYFLIGAFLFKHRHLKLR